jgi:hypothetical protein
MPPRIICFLCRDSKWTTVGPGGGKKSQAADGPNCPEDALNWVDGSNPRRVYCGRLFHDICPTASGEKGQVLPI